VDYHTQKQLFPQAAIMAMQHAINPESCKQANPAPPVGRVDPRRARGYSLQAAHPSAPQGTMMAAMYRPAAPGNEPSASSAYFPTQPYQPSFGVPPAHTVQPWIAPGHIVHPGAVARGYVPLAQGPNGAMAQDPVAQYRAAHAGNSGVGYAMPPVGMAKPLSTSFKGVRLQVRLAVCFAHSFRTRLMGRQAVCAGSRHRRASSMLRSWLAHESGHRMPAISCCCLRVREEPRFPVARVDVKCLVASLNNADRTTQGCGEMRPCFVEAVCWLSVLVFESLCLYLGPKLVAAAPGRGFALHWMFQCRACPSRLQIWWRDLGTAH
jgi:hypothetical protein